MTKNTAVIFLTAMTLSSACATTDADADRAAALLSESLTDAILEGEMGEGIRSSEREARFHFKDDSSKRRGGEPWVGEVNGRVSRSGNTTQDWHFDVALEDFGGEREHFTGDLAIDSSKDFESLFATIYVQGEVKSSESGTLDVDLKVDFRDEHYFFEVEWVGMVDDIRVKGELKYKPDMGEAPDDCKAPIGVDCG
jgi:hypothetical protein